MAQRGPGAPGDLLVAEFPGLPQQLLGRRRLAPHARGRDRLLLRGSLRGIAHGVPREGPLEDLAQRREALQRLLGLVGRDLPRLRLGQKDRPRLRALCDQPPDDALMAIPGLLVHRRLGLPTATTFPLQLGRI